jgi:hypothetical protein
MAGVGFDVELFAWNVAESDLISLTQSLQQAGPLLCR